MKRERGADALPLPPGYRPNQPDAEGAAHRLGLPLPPSVAGATVSKEAAAPQLRKLPHEKWGMTFVRDRVPLHVNSVKDGSVAGRAGIKAHAVIEAVNGVRTASQAFAQALAPFNESEVLLELQAPAGSDDTAARSPTTVGTQPSEQHLSRVARLPLPPGVQQLPAAQRALPPGRELLVSSGAGVPSDHSTASRSGVPQYLQRLTAAFLTDMPEMPLPDLAQFTAAADGLIDQGTATRLHEKLAGMPDSTESAERFLRDTVQDSLAAPLTPAGCAITVQKLREARRAAGASQDTTGVPSVSRLASVPTADSHLAAMCFPL